MCADALLDRRKVLQLSDTHHVVNALTEVIVNKAFVRKLQNGGMTQRKGLCRALNETVTPPFFAGCSALEGNCWVELAIETICLYVWSPLLCAQASVPKCHQALAV